MKIKITNLSKAYKRGFNVLKDINLELESPSMIGLVGPNGAGKTTLMKLLVSQLLPSEGNIMIDGMELYKNEKYLKQRLGYLPQEFGLYEELTVYQFLDYMAALKGIKENRKDFIKKCIVITSLEDKQDIKIRTLSGGQKQRVGIAQALLSSPELFIVDEPTVGLDPEERIKFRNLFSKNASSKLVILSTHIIDDVESICNRLIVMSKGRILFDGTPSQLIGQN
jgi:ABC-type multidrug transport system ATPase subunit